MRKENPEDETEIPRRQTSIRIDRRTANRIKAYQATLGQRPPSVAELIELAWTRYEQRPCQVDFWLARLHREERRAVESLMQFLAGKSPKRRYVARIAQTLIQMVTR